MLKYGLISCATSLRFVVTVLQTTLSKFRFVFFYGVFSFKSVFWCCLVSVEPFESNYEIRKLSPELWPKNVLRVTDFNTFFTFTWCTVIVTIKALKLKGTRFRMMIIGQLHTETYWFVEKYCRHAKVALNDTLHSYVSSTISACISAQLCRR